MERGSNQHERILPNGVATYTHFCNDENFHECVNYLDQELSIYGHPSIATDCGLNQVALINVTHNVLLSYKKSLESHSDTADMQRNAESEMTRLQHLLTLAKEDLANKERELKSKSIEESHLNQRMESLRKKLKADQEKCRRLSAELVSRDTQFKHEKKKKMQEIEKMQTKLHQLLQDKRQDRMLGIEILNSLQRADGRRGRWSTDKTRKNNEQDMYRLIIMNYEDSQKQLLKENNDMRQYLKQMQDELVTALNERINHTSPNSSKVVVAEENEEITDMCPEKQDSSDLSEGMFDMPYDMVKEDIERSLNSKWRALRKEIHRERKTSTEQEIQSDKLIEYQRVIKEQQQLIDYFTASQGGNKETHMMKDSYFLEEKADLEKQKSQFRQQRLAFEKERKYYTDALLQLGQDRQNFEEEKRVWLQKDFMQITPLRGHRQTGKKRASSSGSRSSMRSKGLSASWSGITAKDFMDTSDQESSDNESSSFAPVFTPNSKLDKIYMTQTINRSPSPESHPLTTSRPNSRRSTSPSSPKCSSRASSLHPPTPSTSDLYRVLGIRFQDKENQEQSPGRIQDAKLRTSKRQADDSVAPTGDRKRSGRFVKVDDIKVTLFPN